MRFVWRRLLSRKNFDWNDEPIEIELPNLGIDAFSLCYSLKEVSLPEGCEWSIGDSAFEYCSNLETVTAGCGLINIGNWAFFGCDNLTSVSCLEGCSEKYCNYVWDESYYGESEFPCVGEEAFYGCSNLTEMTVPQTSGTIGDRAFYGDELLTLSTCDYHEDNGRFVVVAKRVK